MNSLNIQYLQHLFWLYIDDWRDRIKILVALELLPDTKNRPVPHTLERLALDRAKTGDQLYALWEAVMPHVPDVKRRPNPFPAPKAARGVEGGSRLLTNR